MAAPPAPTGRPWPTLSPVRRYGPILVVLLVLAGVGGIATAKAKGTGPAADGPAGAPGAGAGTTPSGKPAVAGSGYAANPRLPVFYADAKQAGTLANYDWGSRCDPGTGRIKVPSVYAPPCVPVWNGSKPWKDRGGAVQTGNGGATAKGVTATTITVAFYIPSPQDLATAFQALGVLDTTPQTVGIMQDLVTMGNATMELYGRKVVLKTFQASGDGKDPTSARADAIAVASMGVFASIGGPTQTAAYQDELARKGVLCIACGQAVPGSSYQKDAPYAWGPQANTDQLVNGVLDFGIKNLFGQPARFAGDPAMRTRTRAIGIVHYDQDPPVFGDLEKQSTARLAKAGYHAVINTTYLLNLDTLATQAQTIIGKLKAAKATTVVFLGDPLMPKYLTEQATKQDYHPEWVITGTVYTDTTAAGRLYDQTQWAHAFGASSFPARTKPEFQEPQRLYRWFFGHPPKYTKSLPVQYPTVNLLFTGLDLAGPRLTAQTFAGGLFNYPPSGGGPTVPRVSYGFHGLSDLADYTGVDDITTVWWDASAQGPSEQGVDGKGMWTYPLGGKRFPLKNLPKLPDTGLFQKAGAVTLLSAIPASDRTPPYPPWPGSPAA